MIDAIDAPAFFSKGVTVLVKCAGGELRQNVVWDDLGDVVLVCAKDQFERMLSGYDSPMPIGFRRCDVMAFDEDEGGLIGPPSPATPSGRYHA